VVTIVIAGPILAFWAHAPVLHPIGLAGTLGLVVALPLALGVVVGVRLRKDGAFMVLSNIVGTVALLVLIWEVASQVRLEASYLVGTVLLLVFVLGATLVGFGISFATPRSLRIGMVMPVAIRDFAVAAGIATAAFGAQAIGLLGVYGLLVLILGASATRLLVPRSSPGGTP
jgi:hypothetical protein